MIKEDGREYYEHDADCTQDNFTTPNENALRVCLDCAGVFDAEGKGVCVTDKRFDEPRAEEVPDV